MSTEPSAPPVQRNQAGDIVGSIFAIVFWVYVGNWIFVSCAKKPGLPLPGPEMITGVKTKIHLEKGYVSSFRLDSAASALGMYKTRADGGMKYVFYYDHADVWMNKNIVSIPASYSPRIEGDWYLVLSNAPVQYSDNSVRIDWSGCSQNSLCAAVGNDNGSESFQVVKDGFELEREVQNGTGVLSLSE